MELLAETDVAIALAKPQRPLAAVGVALAFVGLLIAVAGPAIIEARETNPADLPHALAESAHKIKDHLAHKNLHLKSERLVSWKTVVISVGAAVGFLGAALGTASFARREKWRLSGIAIAVGLTAIAWNHFLVAAVAAVALFLMAWVVSQFHR